MTYKRLTACCLDCKKELATIQLSKHIDSKSCSSPNIKSADYDDRKSRDFCIYCNKTYKTFTSLTQHEIRCKDNPNKLDNTKLHFIKNCQYCNKITKSRRHESICKENPSAKISYNQHNQHTKARENGTEYVVTDETRKKLSECNIGKQKPESSKEKLKVSMQKAVLDNPLSYRGRETNRCKRYTCSNGFSVIGTWERDFVEFCVINGIDIIQPTYSYPYIYDKPRRYFPDFYLSEYNCYIEVKGYKTEKDEFKWKSMSQLKKKLLIIDDRSIKKVKENTITIEQLISKYQI